MCFEAVAHNLNRQQLDLKLFEFGNVYKKEKGDGLEQYDENRHLSLFITGRKEAESWITDKSVSGFFQLKGYVDNLVGKFITESLIEKELKTESLTFGLSLNVKDDIVSVMGKVSEKLLQQFDIANDVWYADINWNKLVAMINPNEIAYSKLPKYPSVRRDLALLLDRDVKFSTVRELAMETVTEHLQRVNLFDVYEGEGIPNDKQSYAVSFTFLDYEKTLTDEKVDSAMESIINSFCDNLSAEIR